MFQLAVTKVRRLLTGKEEGASLAEYALLLALIAVVCIAAITLVGGKISTKFVAISNAL